MATQIKLTVKELETPVREYYFDGRTTCTVGRASDCQVQLPNDELHWTVSRHHCQLDIDPPYVQVRDLGSLNGTYLNGRRIGQRNPNATPAPNEILELPELEVRPGDEIQLGATVLQIEPCTPQEVAGPVQHGNAITGEDVTLLGKVHD
jgi:pSer/pThr/pTyr-binding forkhead associated (FHA) protein